jgi:hypothetical protein
MASWRQVVVALEYSLQFETDLMEHVDATADALVEHRSGLGFSAEEAVAVLPTLDTIDVDFSTLIPQPHSDAELRQFCRALDRRLRELASNERVV